MRGAGGDERAPAPFGRRVLLPIAVLALLSLCAGMGFVWFTARTQDNLSREASVEAMREVLEIRLGQLASVVRDYVWWDDAVRSLHLTPDMAWADQYIGPYIYETYGHEMAFVLDAEGRTVYASVDGVRVPADASRLVSHGLDELTAAARAGPSNPPDPATGLVSMAGEIGMAAAGALTPERESTLTVAPEERSVLVLIKRLNAAYLEDLLGILRVYNLRVEATAPVGRQLPTLPVEAVDGAILGHLVWEARDAGRQIVERAAPVLVLVFMALALAAAQVLRFAKRAADALVESEERFRDVAAVTSDWIWETDRQFHVNFLSPRFAAAMGMPAADLIDRPLHDVLKPAPEESGDFPIARPDRTPEPFRDLLCTYDASDSSIRTLRVAGAPIFDRRHHHVGYRGTATDITDEMEARSRAHFLALHDPLTELPNRVLLRERLDQALARVGRLGEHVAVLCLDLDRFKDVNDGLGHGVGDRLLQAVAEHLLATVRDTDTVARVGGDEFVVVQVGLRHPDDAHKLCRRLLRGLERPFRIEGQDLLISASIGISIAPNDGTLADRLLRNADIALLRAKQAGRGTFSYFEPGMDARIQERKSVERDLRVALSQSQFELYYQPRIDLRRNSVAGVEALLRWHHPERGLVSPGEFIPIAEDSGLIIPLSEWVLHTACAQGAAWRHVAVAVNISPVHFKSRSLVRAVRRALSRSGLRAHLLELEVTEGVLLENTDLAVETLRQLRRLGVRISMDDFGTGYASLSYLQRFAFDKIKIDRSFVLGMKQRAHAHAIVRSVVGLGHSLGMQVCAEGVETDEQLEFLRGEGCDEVQGFFFSEAVTAAELERLFLRADAARHPADQRKDFVKASETK